MASPIYSIEGVALNSTDDMKVGSLGDRVYNLSVNLASGSSVYPTGVAGAGPITSAGGAWGGLGNFATVVAANEIATAFNIVRINVENVSANGVYELVLYYGATDIECARIRLVSAAGVWGNACYNVVTVLIPANSQIRAKCEDSVGAGALTISIGYV